jgi:hypothetical protein
MQGTPSNARFIPVRAIFSPILLLQVVTAIIAVWRFFERLVVKLQDGITSERYISISSKIDELFMLVQHGSRFYMLSIFILLPQASLFCKLELAYLSLELRLDSHLVNFILFRLIAWSIDEHSKEEEAHLCYTNNIGYSLHNSTLYSCVNITAS